MYLSACLCECCVAVWVSVCVCVREREGGECLSVCVSMLFIVSILFSTLIFITCGSFSNRMRSNLVDMFHDAFKSYFINVPFFNCFIL
jgi:hypothetical protein